MRIDTIEINGYKFLVKIHYEIMGNIMVEI